MQEALDGVEAHFGDEHAQDGVYGCGGVRREIPPFYRHDLLAFLEFFFDLECD